MQFLFCFIPKNAVFGLFRLKFQISVCDLRSNFFEMQNFTHFAQVRLKTKKTLIQTSLHQPTGRAPMEGRDAAQVHSTLQSGLQEDLGSPMSRLLLLSATRSCAISWPLTACSQPSHSLSWLTST